MIKHIIIINGEPRSGKDTFIEKFNRSYHTTAYSSIDAIKKIAMMCGWDGTKDDKSRDFLAELKQCTTKFNDFSHQDVVQFIEKWNKDIDELSQISPIMNEIHTFLFLHIREINEIKRMVNEFGAITLQIKGNPTNCEINPTNASDLNTDKYDYDYTIVNDGTLKDLWSKAYRFGQQVIHDSK